MTHAKLSPSAAHRWRRCPGSVKACASYPRRESSAASDGTLSHELLEYCIKTETDPTTLVNLSVGNIPRLDSARAERVAIAWNYVKSLGGYVLTEVRLNPEPLVGRDDMMGTADVLIIEGNYAELIDYKDGFEYVESKNNMQLVQYALGVIAAYPTVEQLKLTIIQPKVSSFPSSWVLSSAELIAMVPEIIEQAEASDKDNAEFIPGESQCKWCDHKPNCPALHKQLDVMIPNLNLQTVEMSNEKLAEILDCAPMVEAFLKSVHEEVTKRINEGGTVEGYKLVNGRGSRKWALSDDEIANKLKKMGVPKNAIYKTELVSVAQADKLKWVNKDGTPGSLSKRQLETLDSEYVCRVVGKPTLVPESDPRNAISTVAFLPTWLQ